MVINQKTEEEQGEDEPEEHVYRKIDEEPDPGPEPEPEPKDPKGDLKECMKLLVGIEDYTEFIETAFLDDRWRNWSS